MSLALLAVETGIDSILKVITLLRLIVGRMGLIKCTWGKIFKISYNKRGVFLGHSLIIIKFAI